MLWGCIVLGLPQGLVAPPVQGFAFPVRKMVEGALGGSMLSACDSSDLLHMQGHWYVGYVPGVKVDALQKPRWGATPPQANTSSFRSSNQPCTRYASAAIHIYRYITMAEQLLDQVRDVVEGQIVGASSPRRLIRH